MLVWFLAAKATAANGLVPVAGALDTADGQPASGTVDLRFRLLDGDEQLWVEAWHAVPLSEGTFLVSLGTVEPLDLALFGEHPAAVLAVTVGQDPEMAPIPLGHVPRAAVAERSANAATLDGLVAADLRAAGPVAWSDVTAIPADLVNGDAGIPWVTGEGVSQVADTRFLDPVEVGAWCYDDPAELADALDDDLAVLPRFDAVVGTPPELADGDDDALYAAGIGLRLVGDVLDVDPLLGGLAYVDETTLASLLEDDYLTSVGRIPWEKLVDVPAEWTDGDQDTPPVLGPGLHAASPWTLAVDLAAMAVYDQAAELTDALAPLLLPVGHTPSWDTVTDVPSVWTDGDAVGAAAAGAGMHLVDGKIGVDAEETRAIVGDVAAADATLARRSGATGFYAGRGNLTRVFGVLVWEMADGTIDALDTLALADGESRFSADGHIAIVEGAGVDTLVHLDLSSFLGVGCRLVSNEDDAPLAGLYATATRSSDLWPDGERPTLALGVAGDEDDILPNFGSWTVLCL